jgi:putative endonuclease
MSNKNWVVYLVRCSDSSFYCGVSNDLKNRFIEHNSGKGAKYTRTRIPVELVGVGPQMSKSEALKLEHRIKQLPANKKIAALTSKENEMAILKKDLQTLNRNIKALEKKIEKLIIEFDRNQEAKTTKKMPAKKTPAKKGPAKLTATDQVLKIINRSKKGVDASTLMKKTGYNQKKISNIVHRVYKQGRIKRVGKGIYMGA